MKQEIKSSLSAGVCVCVHVRHCNDEEEQGIRSRCIASFPGLPHFSSLVCVQFNTQKWKSKKNGEGLVSFIT